MGYHTKAIAKGIVGEVSKVKEEVEEMLDAAGQNNSDLLVLCEMADIVGAIKAYLARHHPSLTLAKLEFMADRTAEAFREGHRR